MSDYSSLLANAGSKPRFTDPDTNKVYEVSYLTQAKKAEYEAWLKAAARAALADMKDMLSPAEWQDETRAYRDDVAAGKFSFNGLLAAQARETVDGSAALAAILFGCSVAEMLDLASRLPDLVRPFLVEVIEASAPRKRAEGGEGNVLPPAP